MTRITCGLVIYDEIQEVQKLIPLLEKELQNFQVDWIFVLNHEQSEIRKWVQSWLVDNVRGPLTCFENPLNNLGFARQIILEHSKNELIYLTDPDIQLLPKSIVKLIEYAQLPTSDLKIAGYGGTVKHISDKPFLNQTFELMAFLSKSLPFAFQIQNHSREALVDHIPACHLLLRKSAALEIGGFCYRQPRCGEDIDFTHRAFNLGYSFVFLPNSQVLHWQNISIPLWYYKMFSFGQAQIRVQKKTTVWVFGITDCFH